MFCANLDVMTIYITVLHFLCIVYTSPIIFQCLDYQKSKDKLLRFSGF